MVKQHRLDPECGGEVEENEGSANRDCPAVIPVSQVYSKKFMVFKVSTCDMKAGGA